MSGTRRTLRFADFPEVLSDVEHLHRAGYTAVGKWNLAQVCGHLAVWNGFPVSGYPRGNFVLRSIFWAMKNAFGRQLARRWIESREMKAGLRTMPETVPPVDGSEAEMIDLLKGSFTRFEAHLGEYAESPLLGPLSREETKILHLVHCSHHLGFLVPKGL